MNEFANILLLQQKEPSYILKLWELFHNHSALYSFDKALFKQNEQEILHQDAIAKLQQAIGDIHYVHKSEEYKTSVLIHNKQDDIAVILTEYIGGTKCEVDILGSSSEQFNKYCKMIQDILSLSNSRVRQNQRSSIFFATKTKDGVFLENKTFDKIPFDSIKNNYAESVKNSVSQLIKKIPSVQHGLILMHGSTGTGKTYLIRSLLSEIHNRDAVICSPATVFLSNAGDISDAIQDLDKPFVILEDLGDVFMADSASANHDPFNVLLNYTDGLFSLLGNAIFLLTFNIDRIKMNKALLRPGRCIADINVCHLSKQEAQAILPVHELRKSNYALAEVYAMANESNIITNIADNKTMGFVKE